MFPFDAGLMAIFVAVLVNCLIVLIKLEPPTEFGVDKYPEKELHKKEPEKPKLTNETSKPKTSARFTEILEMPEALPEEPPRTSEAPKPQTPSLKHPKTRPPECPHFFGYLKKIPKNTTIPNKCFICPKMVECILKSADFSN